LRVSHYAADRSSVPYQHVPGQYIQGTQPSTLGPGIAGTVLMAFVLAAFWASIAWMLWGWVGAVIATIVAGFGSILVVGLVRSSSGMQTPVPAQRVPEVVQAA
jgi:hypothetical protein